MAQKFQFKLVQEGESVDYTPTSDTAAGTLVVQGTLVGITTRPILANTLGAINTFMVYDAVKVTGAIAVGSDVYWDSAGNPLNGTAGTGAATTGGGVYIGKAVLAAASGDEVVRVRLQQTAPGGGGGTSSVTVGASTAAAGTTTTDAGVLPAGTASFYPTTAADGTKGVRVNVADKVTGRQITVGNGVSTAVLKIYPPTGGTVNGAAADAAYSTASGKGATLICVSSATNAWSATG